MLLSVDLPQLNMLWVWKYFTLSDSCCQPTNSKKEFFLFSTCKILSWKDYITDMTDYFKLNFEADDVQKISNLGLAHLGDAVYEVMVRSWLCLEGKSTSKGLHAAAIKWVAAPAQAQAVKIILPELTDEEADVFRRGRNAHVNSVPHSATLEE